MGAKLSAEEIVTLTVLKSKGQSNMQIAHTLGVAEGTVRYHLRRQGQPDGRGKTHKAEPLAEVINHWIVTYQPSVAEGEPLRPVNR